jgi:hypothetical protein
MLLRALICPIFVLHPTSHPADGVRVLQKEWNPLSGGVKAIFRIAEPNLDVLNTVYLGPKHPFSVDKGALWARLAGLQFAAQVAARRNKDVSRINYT